MKNLDKKMTLRISFSLCVNKRLKKIEFHYRGSDVIRYGIYGNIVFVRVYSPEDLNFHFLENYADKEWEKYFDYKLEENGLVITYKVNIVGVTVDIAKKNKLGWPKEYDSINFTGLIDSV